jgi:Fic family protein
MNKDFEHLLTEIDFLNSELMLQSFPPDEKIQHAVDVEFTFENNRLEGSTLTLTETDMVIKIGLMMPGKSISEYLAAINHYQAVQFIREQAREQTLLSETLIQQIQDILLLGITHNYTGIYRTEPFFYKKAYALPEPEQLPKLLAENLHWLKLEGPFLHPVIFAAETHQRLMALQPFPAANGTYARLLMNMILQEAGYPPVNFPGNASGAKAYYHAIEQANFHDEKSAWLWLLAKQLKTNIEACLGRVNVDSIAEECVTIIEP